MGIALSLPIWLVYNAHPIWVTYRLLSGLQALKSRQDPTAQYRDEAQLAEQKDKMLKFWVMHTMLHLVSGIVSQGTYTGIYI